jgi:hypothetical protein
VSPPDVDAAGKHPVDEVIAGCNLGEHAADFGAAFVDRAEFVDTGLVFV